MPIYNCEKCNFITENKYDYQRHVKTKKHLRNTGQLEDPKTNRKPTNMQPKTNQYATSKMIIYYMSVNIVMLLLNIHRVDIDIRNIGAKLKRFENRKIRE